MEGDGNITLLLKGRKMERTLKIQLLIGLLVAVFMAGSATAGSMAVPLDPKTQAATPIIGEMLGSLGVVDSYVYQFTSGTYANKYLYTYKLTSTNIGISFFSIGVDDSASLCLNAVDVNYESDGGVDPLYWNPVGNPLQSVDAGFFVTPIYSGQASALLWFIADCAPVMGKASVFGTSSGVPAFGEGDIYTIPEPTTIMLLTAGGLWSFMRRKKRSA